MGVFPQKRILEAKGIREYTYGITLMPAKDLRVEEGEEWRTMHPIDGRRIGEGEERFYEVKQIWDQHQEIIRLIVLGYGNIEIGDITGYSAQTVSNIRNSPVVRERIAELQGELDKRTLDINARVRQFEPIALEYLERIIRGEVEGVAPSLRAKTAENYLSRGGHGTVQKIASVSGTLTREDIEDLKKKAKDAAMQHGAIVMEKETYSYD